jgi:putative sterol carrier protein
VGELFDAGWVAAFKRRIDESDEYRRTSNNWEWPVVLASRTNVGRGSPPQMHYVYLDLWHGVCREACVGSALDVDRVPLVISADRQTWINIMKGNIELLTAVMLRKVTIEKGDVSRLLGSIAAIRALAKAAEAASEGFL